MIYPSINGTITDRMEKAFVVNEREQKMGLFDKFRKKEEKKDNSTSADPASFDLKISEVAACKIDYAKSVEELTAFYDEQEKKIAQGDQEYLTGEFMQLGYAIDFIGFVQHVFQVTLDFEEGVVPAFESVLDALSQGFQGKKIKEEIFGDILKKATGFFSVVIWKNLGGGFISSNLGYGVNVKGTNAFVYNRIARRLQGDASSDMVSLYETLKNL